jgi:hypothetical protein
VILDETWTRVSILLGGIVLGAWPVGYFAYLWGYEKAIRDFAENRWGRHRG